MASFWGFLWSLIIAHQPELSFWTGVTCSLCVVRLIQAVLKIKPIEFEHDIEEARWGLMVCWLPFPYLDKEFLPSSCG